MAGLEKNTNLKNKGNNVKRTGKNKGKNKKSGALGPLIGLLFGSGTVALLLLIIVFAEFVGKSGKVNAGTLDSNGSGKHYSADEEYINIDADSFMGYVGQTYTLSISANPIELVESVVWTSNNEDVVVVDEKGNVVLVGVGVAAVTATAGEYSSAIAIEVVKDSSEQGDMGFNTIGQNNGQNTNNTTNEESRQAADTPGTDENVSYAENEPAGNGSWENVDQDADADATQNGNIEVTSQADVSEETTPEETTQFVPPTTKAADAIDTQEMFSILSNSGFSQYLPNAAIYEVDDEYYGEIIVESDSVHIYIKKRSTTFDMAIRGALAYLLPDTSESVWNVYTTLSKDKTINSDGRKVRFVMPATNAHSQIIVYNP